MAKQLRSMPEYRFTQILFTTELAGEELSAYREIKCYDFLVKPFTEAEFQKAVQTALEMGAQISGYSLSRLLGMVSQNKLLQCHKSLQNRQGKPPALPEGVRNGAPHW